MATLAFVNQYGKVTLVLHTDETLVDSFINSFYVVSIPENSDTAIGWDYDGATGRFTPPQ